MSNNTLWWNGPHCLTKADSCWPLTANRDFSEEALQEQASKACCYHASLDEFWELENRYSSFTKLIRVTGWLFRSLANFRNSKDSRMLGPLSVQKLHNSRRYWIRTVQKQQFNLEINALKTDQPISKGSALRSLHPFLDSENILRVGGRLENAIMTYDEKHPIIFGAQSHFTRLLVLDAHLRTLHGGFQLTLNFLSSQFWIIRGRSLIKGIIRSCVICYRHAARTFEPIMGHLPASRVTPSRPFLHTGLDYAGPIQMRTSKGRGQKSIKGYIALFVCMATKAIHLEAVSDCTTSSFLAAFKRFCSRRGIPATLTSDQATNFRGADVHLQTLFDNASKECLKISELLANDGTRWIFIPPHSPHFGGLWEAGVKSVKHHLRRTVGDVTLTFEELSTVLAEVEACLNSKPLTPLSSCPTDHRALTPGHFLIGTAIKTLPRPSCSDTPINRLDRWQFLRRLTEQFWRRWSTEYIKRLQQRNKWHALSPNLQVNDLVLVKEDNLPPSKWRLARVIEVHAGSDGVVRVATVRTATTELRRPAVKLCRLPLS